MSEEKRIIESWKANASNWINLLEAEGIESRKVATNQAIINAVLRRSPKTILDIGCGEGWLARQFSGKGIQVSGMDVVPALIERAKANSKGDFLVGSYEDFTGGKIFNEQRFDAIVINFALIGKDSTEKLLARLPDHLNPKGSLFIQTLHPWQRKDINDYTTGWKEGSWDGLGTEFTQPYSWYYRTLEDWQSLLTRSGFKTIYMDHVRHPRDNRYLSVIFECQT